jgi:hypothetical protein
MHPRTQSILAFKDFSQATLINFCGAATFTTTAFSIMTPGILFHMNIMAFYCYAECYYALCHYAEYWHNERH